MRVLAAAEGVFRGAVVWAPVYQPFPENYLKEIDVPLLIHQGREDRSVPFYRYHMD